jgi:hypothetical protein
MSNEEVGLGLRGFSYYCLFFRMKEECSIFNAQCSMFKFEGVIYYNSSHKQVLPVVEWITNLHLKLIISYSNSALRQFETSRVLLTIDDSRLTIDHSPLTVRNGTF